MGPIRHMSAVVALALTMGIQRSRAMFYYPSPQLSQLEHILVDNWGAHASNFSSAITPCTNYVTEMGEPALKSGRTTAAQWVRVIFHDFVTANVAAGTGGVDASIGFETAREENKGSAFNDSFTFWRPFVNEFVPMADLVALGSVMSVNLCGGKYIPYRPGRIDATQADPTTGVPEPGTDVEDTLALFARAGFNQVDSIGLTACGHTMGSVHHGGFPDVSPASAVSDTNTNGGVNFDSTRGAFDPLVVQEYVDGTGQMGGPLVTSFNETARSDLRLYESDGNKTMLDLYTRGAGFQDVCVDLMGRMMNTVPTAVELQDPIAPLPIKPVNVTWEFDAADKLVLSGTIRVLWGSSTISNITVSFGSLEIELQADGETGSTVFGSTEISGEISYGVAAYYPFSVSGDSLADITSFTVAAGDLGEQQYPISWGLFIVPSLTTSDGQNVNITVAIPNSRFNTLPPGLSASIAAPVPQPLTLGPTLVKGTAAWTSKVSSKDGFDLWNGVYDVGQPVTGAISLSLTQGGQVIDTYLVDAGVAGW